MKITDLPARNDPRSTEQYDECRRRGNDPCDICGRPLKSRRHYVVEHYQTGELLPAGEAMPDDGMYGCVYVGSECAKQLKGFVRES